MKDIIKEIIENHLPEKKDVNWNDISSPELIAKQSEAYGFNQALSQINTSLIADEVLKVVVEKIKYKKNRYIPNNETTGFCMEETQDYRYGYQSACEELLQELSNLSPNKENKNNE